MGDGDGSGSHWHWSGYVFGDHVGRIHAAMVKGDTPTGRSAAIPSDWKRHFIPSNVYSPI